MNEVVTNCVCMLSVQTYDHEFPLCHGSIHYVCVCMCVCVYVCVYVCVCVCVCVCWQNSVTSRVVNQLLAEMDGVVARKQVFVMGATNRPGQSLLLLQQQLLLLLLLLLQWNVECQLSEHFGTKSYSEN